MLSLSSVGGNWCSQGRNLTHHELKDKGQCPGERCAQGEAVFAWPDAFLEQPETNERKYDNHWRDEPKEQPLFEPAGAKALERRCDVQAEAHSNCHRVEQFTNLGRH